MSLKFFLLGLVVPFLSAIALVWWIHPIIVHLALDKDLVDSPNARKLQKRPVPVLGGLAVYFGLVVGSGLVSVFFNTFVLFPIFVAVTVMMYIGTLDDIRGLSPRLRFIVEILIVLFLIYMDRRLLNDFHGVFGLHGFPAIVSIPLSLITGVGIINAVNLVDGVNGLSSGLCMAISCVMGVSFLLSGDGAMAILSFLCVGALIPFFLHNVFGYTSKMFIGDSGTLMMGTIMTTFVFHILDDGSLVALRFPDMSVIAFTLSCLSIPVFDTVRVMTMRILSGRSPFSADRNHLHHAFIEIGFSHAGTTMSVISLNFLNLICWFASWQLGAGPTAQLVVVLVIGFANTVLLFKLLRSSDEHSVFYRIVKTVALLSNIESNRYSRVFRRFLDADTARRGEAGDAES